MSEQLERGDPFIFMKVGVHAKEDLISIIKRKREFATPNTPILDIVKSSEFYWE